MTGKSRVYHLNRPEIQKKAFYIYLWNRPWGRLPRCSVSGYKTITTYHSTHWNVFHAAPPQSVELALISAGKLLLVMTQTNWYVCTLWNVPHIVSHSQPEISEDTPPPPCRLASCVPCCPHGLLRNSRAGITAICCQSWNYWACPGDSAPAAMSSIIFCKQT